MVFIKKALDRFVEVSGLVPSSDKSQVFYGNVTLPDRRRFSELLRMEEGELPVRYLGVPLVSTKRGQKDCQALIEVILRRVKAWASNYLSFSGQLQLILSTLFSIQVFWCKTFILPVSVVKNCESILRSFLWFGVRDAKTAGKVAWEKVCHLKKEGGLGIKTMWTWNKATILQLGWEIVTEKESMWVRWCNMVLLKNRSFWVVKITDPSSWC
ncbi:hypothetical protein CFOL_v3_16239 [Cephalotus follicularis]|uniref:RVT_1 domain-containing protein n=1 Tax=Cephalotus follicularis TaxID=3775 RepID=A0A1Q3BXV7_CEPFO|nr:hypothetical protein CFOL_v3_16239 [Cephalotus follicularis]